jgi:HlyD family secretion protein
MTGTPLNSTVTANFEAMLSSSKKPSLWKKHPRLTGLAAAVVVALGLVLSMGEDSAAGPGYVTQVAQAGNLVVTVSATGNLEPTNQVELGSELSGTLATVLVDDDDKVSKGQLLAQLDTANFLDAVAKSEAMVAVAAANVQQAKATVTEAQAKLKRLQQVNLLSGGKAVSASDLDVAIAERDRAKASQQSAEASVAEAKANLRSEQTNLQKTQIRSPIDGVVLERAVDPGQTVAASLQAVTLFTLAEDLSKMELKVDVDEADVANVKSGLKASFTVDAWPGRRFQARITRVGYNATDDEGVISYPAVLQVENTDLSLRPGMTGTAEITTLTREQVLLVPNAALRFEPAVQQVAAKTSIMASLMPRPPAGAAKQVKRQTDDSADKQVWILEQGQPKVLQVKTGATDGRYTEIVAGELTAGMAVITEAASGKP